MNFSNKPLKKVYLELTDACNLLCKNCFRNNWHDKTRYMNKELWMKIVNEINENNDIETVVLGGIGEATLHPDFNEIVEILSGKELILMTNGFNLECQKIEMIVKNVSIIVFSIDGLHDNFYDIRRFELEKLLSNVDRINSIKTKNKPYLYAQLVLSTQNLNDVDKLFPYLKKHHISKLLISNLLPQSEESKNMILYTLDKNVILKDYRDKWYLASHKNGIKVKFPNIELKTERICNFVEQLSTFITSNGDVSSCIRFAHPSIEYVFQRKKEVRSYYYGNLKDSRLIDIWHSKSYADLREQNYSNRYPSCFDCDLVNCCDYINDSDCDCKGHYPSCADCAWTRGFIECI